MLDFIRKDLLRFILEIVMAAVLVAMTWFGCRYYYAWSNKVCMDEAEAMKQLWLAQQAEMDKAIYEGLLSEKDLLISEKNAEILRLDTKMASDSIAHLSELDAIRAINQYVSKKR